MSANKGKLVKKRKIVCISDGRKNLNQVLRYDTIVQVRDCHKEQNRARHHAFTYTHLCINNTASNANDVIGR